MGVDVQLAFVERRQFLAALDRFKADSAEDPPDYPRFLDSYVWDEENQESRDTEICKDPYEKDELGFSAAILMELAEVLDLLHSRGSDVAAFPEGKLSVSAASLFLTPFLMVVAGVPLWNDLGFDGAAVMSPETCRGLKFVASQIDYGQIARLYPSAGIGGQPLETLATPADFKFLANWYSDAVDSAWESNRMLVQYCPG